jgi:hypothetical protein
MIKPTGKFRIRRMILKRQTIKGNPCCKRRLKMAERGNHCDGNPYNPKERCGTCRFWDGHIAQMDLRVGCKRYPPVFLPDGNNAVNPWLHNWPKTGEWEWCGEWKPIPIRQSSKPFPKRK